MPDDGPPLTPEDVEAAASVGRLPVLARQLVFDGAWASMEVVLRHARDARLPLGELEDTARAMMDAIAALPAGRRQANADEIRAIERQAAFTINKRLDGEPLTAAERSVLALAGSIWTHLGDLERAARTFERAGDDNRAAEAYGALGDLERMEICLARDEQRRQKRQVLSDAIRRFDTLVAAGERRAALALTATLPVDDLEAAPTLDRAREIERRLCRGRALSLRLPSGEVVRLSGTPATLGRDASCEIVLRDPSVSRRHAVIRDDARGLTISDAGSRSGTRLGGAAIRDGLPLLGDGELALGDHCMIRFAARTPQLLALEGTTGLDRGLRAYVAGGSLPLASAIPGADGILLRFDGVGCRLEREGATTVRVDGRLIGTGCDLLRGDAIEVGRHLRLEVP